MHRWYLTPYHISKFVPGASPECWRKCENKGTLLHVLWSCPRIKRYWTLVFQTIEQITGFKATYCPGMALLSLEIVLIPAPLRNIVSHLLITARLTIVRHWKEVDPPPIAETLRIINTHSAYETQFARSCGNHKQVSILLSTWLTWYSKNSGLSFFGNIK